MQKIAEPARETLVAATYDVVVAGGGIAGMAAAIAAARQGAKVALIEKECLLGGLATLGLITIYLPLCDGMGRQVIFGIGEELLRLSIKHGAEARYPDAWLDKGENERRKGQRYQVQYNPALFAIEVEKLLLSLGVTLWYDTRVCGVSAENGRVNAVFVEHKTGRLALCASAFVDCTGDADLFRYANAPTADYRENRLAMWHYRTQGEKGYTLRIHALPLRVKLPQGERYYKDLSQPEITDMLVEGRRRILDDFLATRESESDFVTHLPLVPLVRMTHRLAGEYELAETEVFTDFEDSIGLTGDWRNAGPVFALPYRTLYTSKLENVFAAGRLISVKTDMWDITRVIPTCAVTGEAAGVAAAMVAKSGKPARALPVKQLQILLKQGGVRLAMNDINSL